MEHRKESHRQHWRLAGHERSACPSISRSDYAVVATARSIRPSNDDQILAVPGDITPWKTVERAIFEGVAQFGRIDTAMVTPDLAKCRDSPQRSPYRQGKLVDYSPRLTESLHPNVFVARRTSAKPHIVVVEQGGKTLTIGQ